jgi:hypothetical protein
MPTFVGFILGVILTIAAAYAYDSSTGRSQNGLSSTAADGHAPLVNWDVVDDQWHGLQTNLRDIGANLERTLKRHTG